MPGRHEKTCVSQMKAIVKLFVREGATAIEYGLIAAGISVVIIAILQAFGANPLK